ncbi:putative MFS family arabinose efflux permease [Thermosporothrix hazakensis]|uniref:Putative MFS family arabinose efflux permease n=1 Tax=Thermosporothrix hazakensis TaxID=644383 RepID=A0A326UBN3_THEHA|nr:MFS transporter [Thermosporothrix hazakensis]PZW34442.1 putative MFS family arabinose efflux permease [Thermosporothrix hazakensis]GCE46008.1 MFS transporter [Thermosporothrix hazakensis]
MTANTQRLSRPLQFLIGGSFLNKLGEFVIPFLTIYLTSARGLSAGQASFIVSLYGLGLLLASLVGGFLTDLIGRRSTMTLSMILSSITMVILGSVRHLVLITGLVFLLSLFTGMLRPAASAAIADLTRTPAERMRVYSLRYWANNVGASVGPLLAGFLAHFSYFIMFLGDAFSSFIFGALIWFGVPETRPRGSRKKQAGNGKRGLLAALANPLLLCYATLILLNGTIYRQYSVALPLDMEAHGLGEQYYGMVLAVNGVVIVLASIPVNRFFERFSANSTLALAAVLLGCGFGMIALLQSFPWYLVSVVVWTLGELLSTPVENAVIADIAPAHLNGSYQGVHSAARSFATFTAPLIGGLVFEHLGPAYLWIGCLGMGLLVACCYLFLRALRARQQSHSLLEAHAGD